MPRLRAVAHAGFTGSASRLSTRSAARAHPVAVHARPPPRCSGTAGHRRLDGRLRCHLTACMSDTDQPYEDTAQVLLALR